MLKAISNTSPLLYLYRIGGNVVNPKSTPSEWLALDLGVGEIAAMALALENPDRVVLLDDMLVRRTAQVAGLQVWGTLKVLLEAKSHGVIGTSSHMYRS